MILSRALETSDLQALLRQAIGAGLVRSAHDLSDGGLAVAAAEACLAAGLGAQLELPACGLRLDRLLFAEGGGRLLLSVAPGNDAAWWDLISTSGVSARQLGLVSADPRLRIRQAGETLLDLALEPMGQAFEQAIPRRLAQAGPPPDH